MIGFRQVSKRFGAKQVLDDFSLVVEEGETTVVIGYSGSGKSVALKHVVGLITPDQGEVVVDGQVVHALDDAALMALRARIGFVFQFAALFDSMTVGENIALGLRRRGLDGGEIEERVRESLGLVGLEDAVHRLPGELSGGMRKRVGIARAIALRPKYLLYDEPTTGLDPVTAAAINALIVRTRRQFAVTAMVVTHDMNSAYTVGDRIAMLYRGGIRQVGTVEQIRHTADPVVRQFIEGRPEAVSDAETAATGVVP